jgi:hypothetical protein
MQKQSTDDTASVNIIMRRDRDFFDRITTCPAQLCAMHNFYAKRKPEYFEFLVSV